MAMTRFAQWWKRAVRCGHAYAEGAARYGRTPERHFVRQVGSTIFWGLLLPLIAVGLAWPTHGASLVLLCGYLVLFWRSERYFRIGRGWRAADARLYAAFCVLAKFPHVAGMVKYWSRRIRGKPAQIIEYRGSQTAPAGTAAQSRARSPVMTIADDQLAVRPYDETMSAMDTDQASSAGRPARRVVVAATFTAEPLQESMDFWMRELELPATVEFAPYDQVFQQLLDPGSLLAQNRNGVNVVLLALR